MTWTNTIPMFLKLSPRLFVTSNNCVRPLSRPDAADSFAVSPQVLRLYFDPSVAACMRSNAAVYWSRALAYWGVPCSRPASLASLSKSSIACVRFLAASVGLEAS